MERNESGPRAHCDGRINEIYLPALEAKDFAVALEAQLAVVASEAEQRDAFVGVEAARSLGLALDDYGDLGNREKIYVAYDWFEEAVEAIREVAYRVKTLVSGFRLRASRAVDSTVSAHKPTVTTFTYNKDIYPIFEAKCGSCHRNAGVAPMSLSRTAKRFPWAVSIKNEVLHLAMPPWFVDERFGSFKHSPAD